MSLKCKILTELEGNRDAALSGQALAARFGVSRNAVWKAVNGLRADGYEVESTPNRGYRLSPLSDRLSAEVIRDALSRPDVPVYHHDTLDSTNNEAKRLLADGVAGPFLVLAGEQTAGRGRHGKAFYSPKDAGLYLTVVLSPEQTREGVLGVTAFAAVCVAQAVWKLTGLQPGIRWVNDLFIDGRKVCGILTEAVTDCESGAVESLLIGIGLNLRPSELPAELQGIVGNLGARFPIRNRLSAEIAERLLGFRPGDSSYLPAYRAHSLTLGRRVFCQQGTQAATGLALDIDADGALLVQSDRGETLALRTGEVKVLSE